MAHLSTRTLQWFSRHAGFPSHRLPPAAELLVLFAATAEAAAADEAAAIKSKLLKESGANAVAQRQLAFNRSRAHFKSDNRSKV